jgi:hypothetical protein
LGLGRVLLARGVVGLDLPGTFLGDAAFALADCTVVDVGRTSRDFVLGAVGSGFLGGMSRRLGCAERNASGGIRTTGKRRYDMQRCKRKTRCGRIGRMNGGRWGGRRNGSEAGIIESGKNEVVDGRVDVTYVAERAGGGVSRTLGHGMLWVCVRGMK